MKRNVLLGLSTLFLAILAYRGILYSLVSPWVALPDIPGGVRVLTLFLMLSSFFHAWYSLGARNTLVFFALSAVVSWAFEQAGVATGLIYGPYHYTDRLGPKLGHVPLLIPIAWFMMIYPSYVISNLIADGQPAGTRGGLGRIAWLAFLGAVVMTAWDVAMDPIMSGPGMRAWIWEQGGPYFGVPAQNFAGWVLTTFTVYLLYRMFERRASWQPAGPMTPVVAAMPLVAYGTMMMSGALNAQPEAIQVIAPFVMGVPVMAAAGRLVNIR